MFLLVVLIENLIKLGKILKCVVQFYPWFKFYYPLGGGGVGGGGGMGGNV